MSENEREHDLDSAFDRMAREMAHRPAPGAAQAVRAGRRRRTTSAVAASAAVVLIGAGAYGVVARDGGAGDDVGRGGRSGTGYAAVAQDPPLPAAAAWEPNSLGLGSGWTRGEPPADQPDPLRAALCDNDPAGAMPGTPATSEGLLTHVRDGDRGLAAYFLDLGDDTAAATSTSTEAARLASACATDRRDRAFPGGASWTWLDTGSAEQTRGTWIAHWQGRVAIGSYAAPTGDDLDDAAIERVGDALIAAVQDASSYAGTDSGGDGDGEVDGEVDRPDMLDFIPVTEALGAWMPSAAPTVDDPNAPCLASDWSAESEYGDGGTTDNGMSYESAAFADPAAAAARVAKELATCELGLTESELDVAAPDGKPITASVWRFDRGGKTGHGAVWMLVDSERVVLVTVNGAAGPVSQDAAEAAASAVAAQLG